jgi:uncharacterized integral membrane protein
MYKNQFLFVVGLIFAVIVTVFAMANARPVEINLLFTKFYASQALLIFFSAALGAVLVTFMGLIRHFKLTGELRTLRKENEKLRNQSKFNEDEKKSTTQTKAEMKADAKAEAKAEVLAETNPQDVIVSVSEEEPVETKID